MMKSYKICVVGAGPWGLNHIRTLQKIGSLGGVVDSDNSTLDGVQKAFPLCSTFLSIDESFKKVFVAYIVATPPKSHFLIAKRIIEKKRHLLIEKPITLDLNEAKELNKLAKKNNVSLMVGHLLLFHPANPPLRL